STPSIPTVSRFETVSVLLRSYLPCPLDSSQSPDCPGCSCEQQPDEPAPSLHPHYRSFITTTNRSAGATATVLNASQFLLLGTLPLAPLPKFPSGAPCRLAPSHVPHRSRRPGSRPLHAGHRLARNPGTRQTHPGILSLPRFWCQYVVSTRQQWIAFARLPGPHLTPSGMPFPHPLSTTVFS